MPTARCIAACCVVAVTAEGGRTARRQRPAATTDVRAAARAQRGGDRGHKLQQLSPRATQLPQFACPCPCTCPLSLPACLRAAANMSNFGDFQANNAAFAASFKDGDKPMPPARKALLLTCMDGEAHGRPPLSLAPPPPTLCRQKNPPACPGTHAGITCLLLGQAVAELCGDGPDEAHQPLCLFIQPTRSMPPPCLSRACHRPLLLLRPLQPACTPRRLWEWTSETSTSCGERW